MASRRPRRRSVDSSSSCETGATGMRGLFHFGRKKKQDKQEEAKTETDRYPDHLQPPQDPSQAGPPGMTPPQAAFPQPAASGVPPVFNTRTKPGSSFSPQFPEPSPGTPDSTMPKPSMGFQDQFDAEDVRPPPAYRTATPPPSGFRVPLDTDSPFPPPHQAGYPPCVDADRRSPVFLGSALMRSSVHPCKVAPGLVPPCRVPYGGTEYEHRGRYDLLPFLPDSMEWVRTSGGRIPPGRRPIEGGYEENGTRLYHALANINGVRVPGKTGEHLGGCNVAFGGGEQVIHEGYEILCWK